MSAGKNQDVNATFDKKWQSVCKFDFPVTPAKAGARKTEFTSFVWIPAFVGMTVFLQTCKRTAKNGELPVSSKFLSRERQKWLIDLFHNSVNIAVFLEN